MAGPLLFLFPYFYREIINAKHQIAYEESLLLPVFFYISFYFS